MHACLEELYSLIKSRVLEGKAESFYESSKELMDELLDEHTSKLNRQQRKLLHLELLAMEEEEGASIQNMSNLSAYM